MKVDQSSSIRSLLSLASGQVHALSNHDKWIVGYGDTSRSDLIMGKLLSMNTTSGEVNQLLMPTRNTLISTPVGEKLVPEPLFPGYFLIGVNSSNPHWQDMRGVEEVYSILNVHTDEYPERRVAFLDAREIGRIVEMIQEIGQEVPVDDFAVGDVVVVNEGPFKNLGGRIVEMRGRRKAKVEIVIRGKTIPTEFSLTALKPRRSGRETESS